MLHAVWLKVLVPLLAAVYVAYRVSLAHQISKARRAGDRARVEELTTKGFRLYRYALAACLVLIAMLAFWVYANAR